MTRTRDVATQGGLVLVASQTIGSAVASVTVSNAFSATYDNYRVIVNGGVGTTPTTLALRLGATTSGYNQSYSSTNFSGTATPDGSSNQANFSRVGYADTTIVSADFELQNPFTAKYTILHAKYVDSRTTGGSGFVGGSLNNTTSYTDFTLTVSGTLTGGTIRIYGVRN